MIKIKYYPVRFEKECKIFEYDFLRSKTLEDYLKVTGLPYTDCEIIIEGKTRNELNKFLNNDTEIIVTPKIGWSVVVQAVGWLITKFIAHWVTYSILIISTAYSINQAISARKRLGSFGSLSLDGGLDEGSPTYGWDGIRTIQEIGVPVKIVYGEHRTGGNIINQYVSTDGDKNYLNLLIGICEGEIEDISSIKINDQPIENFEGITTYERLGTNSQSVIPNFEDLHNVYNINIPLLKNNPYIYTTDDEDVEGFDIKLTLPQGLYKINSDNGAVESWDVVYNVQYKLHTDPSYTDLGNTTISGKSRSALYRIFSKRGLTAGQYDIKITKVSDDSTLEPQQVGDLSLDYVDEIKTDDLVYPYTALLGIKALATEQLSGSTPNITFVIKGKKVIVPKVLTGEGGSEVLWEDYYYDPDDEVFRKLSDDSELYWDGESYVERWCANPIWCLKDLLLNTRYGIGEFIQIQNINEEEMLEMALYCEGKVSDGDDGYEKRFRLDVVLDTQTKAPDLLTQLTAVFRAFPFYSGGAYSFSIDKAELPSQVFGMGNIIKNNFTQTWKSKNDIYNIVEVQILDEELDYKEETIVVIDEASIANGDPIRKKEIRLFSKKKSYAIREGKYALWISKYINRSLSFKCAIDAIACRVGDVINLSHDVPQWGFSGRVKPNSTTTIVKLDREVIIEEGKSYKVMVKFSDDTIEDRVVTDPAGSYTELNVSVAFGQIPKDYDNYSFGESTKVVKPFRIMGISRLSEGEVLINAIEYNESVYDTSGIALPTNNYSALTIEVPNVSNLVLTEGVVVKDDGSVEYVIDVSFTKPLTNANMYSYYARAKIYFSDNDGKSWIYKGDTIDEQFRIEGGIYVNQTYKVAVVSVNNRWLSNPIATSPQAEITIVGKSELPSDVEDFVANYINNYIEFSWDEVSDKDLIGYEIRELATPYSSWSSGTIIASRITMNSYSYFILPEATTKYFAIKARDTSGNYSENYAVVTMSMLETCNVGDIFYVDDDPLIGKHLRRLPVGEYGMVLTCGGANQSPFWDWVYGAAGGVGGLTHVRQVTIKSYHLELEVIMDTLIAKEALIDNGEETHEPDNKDSSGFATEKDLSELVVDKTESKEAVIETSYETVVA